MGGHGRAQRVSVISDQQHDPFLAGGLRQQAGQGLDRGLAVVDHGLVAALEVLVDGVDDHRQHARLAVQRLSHLAVQPIPGHQVRPHD